MDPTLWIGYGLPVNGVDLVLAAALVVGLAIGLTQGLIRQSLSLLALYLSLVLAAQYYPYIANNLRFWIGNNSTVNGAVALAATFVVMALILNGLTHYVYRQTGVPALAWADRLAGAGLGFVWSWAIAGLALTVIAFATGASWQSWEDNRQTITLALNHSSLAHMVSALLPHLYQTMRPWLPLGIPAPFLG
jgi:uncharacterized membrane protein required for colicin V production